MARKTKTTTTPLEQISSDLKLSESKKHELSRAFQDLQSLSSSIFTLTVQWQDLQSDFDTIEASLKNGIQELESKEKEIARKVQSVEARIKNLEAREGEFAVRSSQLEARERGDSEREFAVRFSKLEDSEREFAVRFGKLEDSEREFAVRSSKLEDCERRVKNLEKEVARKEQSVEARIKNVEARKSEFAVRFSKLEDSEREFAVRSSKLEDCELQVKNLEKEVARKEQSVEARIKNVEATKSEFAVRFSKLEDSEREFLVRSSKMEDCELRVKNLEKEVARKEQSVEARIKNFEAREDEFKVRLSKLEDRERRVKSLEIELARKEQSVEARTKNVEARKIECAVRSSKLKARERRVKSLEEEVARKEQSVEARIKDVEARKSEFAVRFGQLEDREREFAVRSSKLEDNEREFAVRFSKLEDCEARFMSLENWNHGALKGEALQLVLNERIDVLEKSGDVILAVIKVSSDPAKLVLDAMEGFYPLPKNGGKEFELEAVRRSCVLLLEQLLRASPPIMPNVRDDAKRIANEWKGKMSVEELEVLGLLLLVGVYGLVPEFDKDEFVTLFGVVAEHRLASEICRILGITDSVAASEFDHIAWTPPLEGFVKVNFDGSFIRKDQLGGLGVVVRDKNGKVIAARARKTLGVLKSNVVELLAAKEALDLVSSLGFKKIVVEGDCQSAINLLLGKTTPKKDENAIALDAICLASGFTSCLFTHVKREGNKVADGLSKFATKVDSVEEWKEDLPSWLSISSELDIQGIAENKATMQFDFPDNVNDQQYQCPGTQASMDHDGSSNLSVPCLQDAAAAPDYYNTPTSDSVNGLPPNKSVDIHCFSPVEWIISQFHGS